MRALDICMHVLALFAFCASVIVSVQLCVHITVRVVCIMLGC
jgi:hypothetical protein